MRRDRGEELSPEDRYYLESMAKATLRHWENTYYQYKAGLFDDEEFAADFEVWRSAMSQENYLDHWKTQRKTCSEEFRQVIDQLR